MVLFLAYVDGHWRIVAAPHEAEAARIITDRYGMFPEAIDVAPFYEGSL